MLPNTPTKFPIAAVLAHNLLTPGGREISEGGDPKKEVYIIYTLPLPTPDLPAPRESTAVATLSVTEILVIGCWNSGGDRVNTVYKGCLQLKPH